jgi:hypothetical protein
MLLRYCAFPTSVLRASIFSQRPRSFIRLRRFFLRTVLLTCLLTSIRGGSLEAELSSYANLAFNCSASAVLRMRSAVLGLTVGSVTWIGLGERRDLMLFADDIAVGSDEARVTVGRCMRAFWGINTLI